MNIMKIRKVNIGLGRPKIILPITAETPEDALSQAEKINALPHDLVELRADHLNCCFDERKTESLLCSLREALGETPIIFTFRSQKEGGEKDISKDDYLKLNFHAIHTGFVDVVDAELFMDLLPETVKEAHSAKVKVIASSHDFEKTPSKEEILYRLKTMDSLGADILKVAVMPKTKEDVLTLLSATAEMHRHSNKPLVTMSMGQLGMISRIAGETFGSSMTFGCAEKASAPGQLPAEELEKILNILHTQNEL